MYTIHGINLLKQVILESTCLIASFPGRETLWCHRRHLLQVLLHMMAGEKDACGALPSYDKATKSIRTAPQRGRQSDADVDMNEGSVKCDEGHVDLDGVKIGLCRPYDAMVKDIMTKKDSKASENSIEIDKGNTDTEKSLKAILRSCLFDIVVCEIDFSRYCYGDDDCWEPVRQKKYSVRYLGYVLYQVHKCITVKELIALM